MLGSAPMTLMLLLITLPVLNRSMQVLLTLCLAIGASLSFWMALWTSRWNCTRRDHFNWGSTLSVDLSLPTPLILLLPLLVLRIVRWWVSSSSRNDNLCFVAHTSLMTQYATALDEDKKRPSLMLSDRHSFAKFLAFPNYAAVRVVNGICTALCSD